MASLLHQMKCLACEGGVPKLSFDESQKLLKELNPAWGFKESGHLFREFRFPDFKSALDFTNKVGALAEEEGHHPDILLQWGKVGITLYTHSIQGLTQNDFILAAKIDQIP